MEKRVLIAIVLSIAVMYGYSILFPQQKPLQSEKPVSAAVQQQAAPSVPAASAGSQLALTDSNVTAAKDVTVETEVMRAVFNSQGGALKELKLKKYKDKTGANGSEIILFRAQKPEHFTLATVFAGIVPPSALYSADVVTLNVSGKEQKSVEFSYLSPDGIQFKKKYSFTGSGYGISLDATVTNPTAKPVEGSLQINLLDSSVKPGDDPGRFEVFGPATLSEAGVSFDSLADIAKAEKVYQKGVRWTAFGDKYFLKAVIAKGSGISSVSIKEVSGYCEQRVLSEKLAVNPGQQGALSYSIYFGPKDIDILKSQGEKLEGAIDLGWFAILAKPLLHSLKLFYGYLHNYGLAIILITVILKIIFFPLTHKSYKSMKEMQKLQPKMQELKEKFKDDRDGLNRSVMELYKTHKVNPLGGCLPMIVQIPVFFGLYKALMFSIELRHAPFYFWLQDLSAKDPYYVTPIIMGVTMFIQQKMTPTNMDPVQAKMMLALPVVFTAMFLNFPSGLVLYWLVNNILTIAQQAYINKTLKEV